MEKFIAIRFGKVLKVPDNTVILKADPTVDEKEYVDARIVINTQVGPKTEIPVIILLRADDYEGDIHELAATLVAGMDQYPTPENVRAVSVITCGETHYPGISWVSA